MTQTLSEFIALLPEHIGSALSLNLCLFVVCLGSLLAWSGRLSRQRYSLRQRVEPYVRRPSIRSVLLQVGERDSKVDVAMAFLRRVIGPGVRWATEFMSRIYGSNEQTLRRIGRSGQSKSVDQVRGEQIVGGLVGGTMAATLAGLMANFRGTPIVIALLLTLAGVLAGSSYIDWRLTRKVKSREEVMLHEFPTIAELLALSVAAGESPLGAIQRMSNMCNGEVVMEFRRVIGDVNAGMRLSEALLDLSDRSQLVAMSRFARTISVSLERGTPLAEVFRAQAQDVREEQKRKLLETAGKKEIMMLIPVVFLILPIVLCFAVYPGLMALNISF